MFFKTLSGRFLLLTILFVMLAEILIFVPSIARFREDYLLSRLERAQIASLAILAEDMIDPAIEAELLETAGIFNVVLRRDAMRQLMLSSEIPGPIYENFDLRDPTPWGLIGDALRCLVDTEPRVIRVIGNPVRQAGLLIEITMPTGPLRKAMLEYGINIFFLSAFISIVTAALLFLAVRVILVKPIARVVDQITRYAAAPEDARRIIQPNASVLELRKAEDALQTMQTQLTGALRQKERLAQLGGAVAKISHDLRNILTTATLFADRVEASEDPAVRRVVPKLINSLSRAVNLTESTLAFGKAEEAPPALTMLPLDRLIDDVAEGEKLAIGEASVRILQDVPRGMTIRADGEQLYRILSNLTRNARQAIATTGKSGIITLKAEDHPEYWNISVADTGPGLPAKAQKYLFQPFQGGTRREGTGLGLAIAAELVRGHGGRLKLQSTGPQGTCFCICLPKSADAFNVTLS
ncbi:MAG: HAMP domain-containing sensor histidine kinase [Pseudomonadota bacterium]